MKFTKMHGAGNDFVIINNIVESIPTETLPELARRLCSRRSSIGADGMMVVVPPEKGGDYGMLFYNADGSLGEMCGNGARCICRYGLEKGLAVGTPRIETTAGIVSGQSIDGINFRIRLNDPTVVDIHRSVSIDGNDYDCAYVELGCPGLPHCILLMDWKAWDMEALGRLGRKLRYAPEFPKGANVSFVSLVDDNEVDIITFERGVEDFTLACGTGCGATAVSLFLRGVSGRELKLHAPGGKLSVKLCGEADEIDDLLLTGPTCIVCEGEVCEEVLE